MAMRRHGTGCSAVNCKNRRYKNPDKSFFRFPMEEERCSVWVQNSGRQDLIGKSSIELHKGGYVLCSDHFEAKQFSKAEEKKRLMKKAVPTLFVPKPSNHDAKVTRQEEASEDRTGSHSQTSLSESNKTETADSSISCSIDAQSCTSNGMEGNVQPEISESRLHPLSPSSANPPVEKGESCQLDVTGSEKMEEGQKMKAEVKIEIDVAEDLPQPWYTTENHSYAAELTNRDECSTHFDDPMVKREPEEMPQPWTTSKEETEEEDPDGEVLACLGLESSRHAELDDEHPWAAEAEKDLEGLLRVLVNTDNFAPVDFFQLFFPDSAFALMTEQSNLNAEQLLSRVRNIGQHSRQVKVNQEFTISEMKAYAALQVAMGLCRKPLLEDYWRTYWLTKVQFGSVMSRVRYELITRCLCFNDNSVRKERWEVGYDPLFKIRPLLNIVEPLYKLAYCPGKELAIEESAVKYKGSQLMPGKPDIRQLSLSEARTGYMLQFVMDSKKDTSESFDGGLFTMSEHIVHGMLKEYHHTDRTVFIDSSHRSLKLVKELKASGIRHCGTMKHGRVLTEQLLKLYPFPHKVMKWYHGVYHHLREVALTNAYIIYKTVTPEPLLPARLFREKVIDGLLESYTPSMKNHRHRGMAGPSRLTERHFIRKRQDNSRPECVVCSSRDTQGWKRVQTRYECKTCLQPMCPTLCFELYHTHQNYRQAAADQKWVQELDTLV